MNECKINFLAKIQVPVNVEMVPGDKSKSAEVTEPVRAAAQESILASNLGKT